MFRNVFFRRLGIALLISLVPVVLLIQRTQEMSIGDILAILFGGALLEQKISVFFSLYVSRRISSCSVRCQTIFSMIFQFAAVMCLLETPVGKNG